jgi:hypothetical protein
VFVVFFCFVGPSFGFGGFFWTLCCENDLVNWEFNFYQSRYSSRRNKLRTPFGRSLGVEGLCAPKEVKALVIVAWLWDHFDHGRSWCNEVLRAVSSGLCGWWLFSNGRARIFEDGVPSLKL